MRRASTAIAALIALAGCASSPPAPPAPAFDAAAVVARIRAVGDAVPTEVEVQPLQDPAVTDLREQARRDERAGRIAEAATALDRALVERSTDPAVLQERAEVALLQRRLDDAAAFATRARAAGPGLGPLCRRIRETLVQVERLRTDGGDATAAARADAAARDRDACTVTPPPRY